MRLSIGKAISRMGAAGVLAVLMSVVFVGLAAVLVRSSGNGAGDVVSIDSVISSVRRVGEIKVLAVYESGIMEYPARSKQGYKDGHVDCMYRGVAELSVDLTSAMYDVCETNGGMKVTITLKDPVCGAPREWPYAADEDDTIFRTYCEYGGSKKKERERIRDNIDKIKAKYIERKIMTPERISMARSQAELVLKGMLAPCVGNVDSDVAFKWEAADTHVGQE